MTCTRSHITMIDFNRNIYFLIKKQINNSNAHLKYVWNINARYNLDFDLK